ncbi:MAG: tRNA (adenosine(37)-N6)-dimethylallyltransferase MiaA [Candidatus Omnitrophica bacterium]|nr:tRNA (adenosine(37)-N6)-dimethylallyltransferase MiaA [Candidatus Omnitrophota bacterium]MCB9720567.1 tRNA (adenosine(37)-N6)-dimethylallyltransferase MiaA [Candidatus Omnitrophota bacterium]
MAQDKVLVIVGPTAVGKSAAAYALAVGISCPHIISCDSAQVYREINVASNKPDDTILRRIPHHLVGIMSVTQRFDVYQFNRLAVDAIDATLAAGGTPLVVGGSGLYMKVLLDGIFEGEPADLELRVRLLAEARLRGREHLHGKLQELDPAAADKIHPNDLKKMVRALEVCLLEDRPISEKQKECHGIWGRYDVRLIGLNEDRAVLYERINARVEQMFMQGILQEMQAIKDMEISPSAAGLIGLREVFDYIDGKIDLDQAKELMKRNTRRFAKRQLTWFRKEGRINWIQREAGMQEVEIVRRIREAAEL